MTNMTMNGMTTLEARGHENYETFKRKTGGKTKTSVMYDYRHTDGELFSCVKPTLEDCQTARDQWLEKKGGAQS